MSPLSAICLCCGTAPSTRTQSGTFFDEYSPCAAWSNLHNNFGSVYMLAPFSGPGDILPPSAFLNAGRYFTEAAATSPALCRTWPFDDGTNCSALYVLLLFAGRCFNPRISGR
ncbi:hypothetical protein C8R47DRAFT_1220134 [Mycena vitilis]|nr:hypothetical protein C8R47DRAFT_1220134 [Mycena vitilis]